MLHLAKFCEVENMNDFGEKKITLLENSKKNPLHTEPEDVLKCWLGTPTTTGNF